MLKGAVSPWAIRVLLVIADGDPGGGTTHVLQLLRGLQGACCMGLVTQRGSYLLGEAHSLGVPTFGVDFFRSRLDPSVPLRLRRIVREFEAEVVHAHGGRAGFFYALARSDTPMVYTVHGYHFLHKGPITRWFAIGAEWMAACRAQAVIFVSEHDARVAREYGLRSSRGYSTVIHNGIPSWEITTGARGDARHVGFVGRLEQPKDPLLFLDVMERLPTHTATIVGGGSLEGVVETEIQRRRLSHVRTTGTLPHTEILRFLPSLSVLVMTSRWEGLPILALEAMRSGVPVVATKVGGLSEVIEDGKSGLLVEGRSADDIAWAVTKMTGESTLREQIVEEGQERVQTLFSEKRMLSEVSGVYGLAIR